MIYLTLYNKLWIKIECDKFQILEDIKERFSFHVPGYYFMPRYRSGVWNGKINVFDYKNRLLPYGLLFDLIKFLKKKKYEVSASNDLKELFGLKDDYKITYDLKFKPRNYQDDIIKTCVKYKKGLFISSTASGKSVMISYIIDNLMKNNFVKRSIIVVPTTSLILQFYDDLVEYGMDENLLGKFYADEKDWNKPILISTWQSLTYDNEKIRKSEITNLIKELKKKSLKEVDKNKFKKRLDFIRSKEYIENVQELMQVRKDLLESMDCVIVDEVQTAKSTQVNNLMQNVSNAEWRFGCTGTLPKSQLDQCNIKSFIGPVIVKYGVKELTDLGYLNKCEIHRLSINYRKPFKGSLNEVKDQLFENLYRQYVLNNLVKENEGHNILFLVNRIKKEGDVLENHLKETFPDYQIKFISGSVKAKEREVWRKKCNSEEKVILIANYSLFQAGINIPTLSRIVLASSFKGEVRILQSIGRSLRTSDKKKHSIVYDICDNVKYMTKHGNERLKIYEEEEFEIKNIKYKEK